MIIGKHRYIDPDELDNLDTKIHSKYKSQFRWVFWKKFIK